MCNHPTLEPLADNLYWCQACKSFLNSDNDVVKMDAYSAGLNGLDLTDDQMDALFY